MKTNYEFQGNKIIKTMELNEDGIIELKKIDNKKCNYLNSLIGVELESFNLVVEDKNLNCYFITNLGKQFLEKYNQQTDKNKSTTSNILQVPTKFQLGQTVYTIRKIKLEEPCPMCNGDGVIKELLNGISYIQTICRKCKGTGKSISNKFINVVCNDEFTIKTINPNIDKDVITVKYKIQSGTLTLKRAEENLFLSKEEAQKKCNALNDSRVTVNVSDIVIPDAFKNSKPSTGKILKKLDYYNRYGKFNTDITLDKDNVLLDGYINYLICQLLHIETIKVIIKDGEN